MRSLIYSLLVLGVVAGSNLSYAFMNSEPTVSRNVLVKGNIAPSQCPRSWNGRIAPEDVSIASGYGMNTGTLVGVQSCVRCSYHSNLHSCVCATCYGYYN